MIRFHSDMVDAVDVPEDVMARFRDVREFIEELCIKYEVPIPIIGMAIGTDPCDFTSPEQIRLNLIAAGDQMWYDWYPRHVFGHYLANLEQTHCWSDRVAELIAGWSELPMNAKEQLERPVEFECEEDDPDCGRSDCRIHGSDE